MAARQKRVLIVDDEEDLTWTLSKKLSKDSEVFDLFCVNSGREAIEVLKQMPFDLVVTDVRMPEVSGLDLLVQIKELYPSTKVAIMTAYGNADVQKEATRRGCFNYIEKPFEINEMRRLILDAVTQRRGFKGSVADFQLSDIIQLNCLGRLTSALKISCEDEKGIIYFQDGNIVHAESNHLSGEAAFYYIMSWQGGEFSVMRNQRCKKETISRGWQSLLLESLRRVDENSDLAKQEIEREKRKRRRRIQRLLGRMLEAQGVEDVLLHTRAGFPLYYQGQVEGQPDRISELGNLTAGLIEKIGSAGEKLQSGAPQFGLLQFEQRLCIFQKIPRRDAYLSLLCGPDVNSGYLRLEIRKNLADLSELL